MHKKSKELFTESIRQSILQSVGLFESKCQLLDGFESIIFKAEKGGLPCVLRVSHSLHRTPNVIRGEIEWIDYLAQHDLRIPQVLPLPNGEHLVSVTDNSGGAFTAVLFSWAEGKHHWEYEQTKWTPVLFETMGEMTGKMHALAHGFELQQTGSTRPHWHEDPDLDLRAFLPKQDEAIAEKLDALNQKLMNLPTTAQSYGLIHFDFHGGNFFVDKHDHVTLFDFDDCMFNFFIADIAMAAFYAASFDCKNLEELEQMRTFFRHFMLGYRKHNQLDRKWFAWIPAFMKQREIVLYGLIHRSFDVSHPESMDDWPRNFMEQRREKIMADTPFVDLDWLALVDGLIEPAEVSDSVG